MSISSLTNTSVATGTDLVSVYPYAYKIFANTEIEVIVRLIASPYTRTTLTLTTDYTISGVGESGGGNITLVNASQAWLTGGYLRSTYKIFSRRKLPLTQATSFRNQGGYYPEGHEDQADRDEMTFQQHQGEIDRSVKIPPTYTTADFDTTLPDDFIGTASAYLTTNSTGTGFETGANSTTKRVITGTRAAPSEIVAATGIVFTGSYWDNVWFIAGSGGAVTVTAAARIAAGTNAGQELTLIGRSDTNTVTLEDGNGIETGGQTLILVADSVVTFIWDSVNWVLKSTNGL